MGAMGRRDGPHLHDLGSKWSRLVLVSGLQRHIGHSQPLLTPRYPSPSQAYPRPAWPPLVGGYPVVASSDTGSPGSTRGSPLPCKVVATPVRLSRYSLT